MAAALACTALAWVWFGGAYATEEANQPFSPSVVAILALPVLTVATLGIVLGVFATTFPWLAVFLTPLCLGVSMALIGDGGLSDGFWLGSYTAVVFLASALAGRGLKHWAHTRGPIVG